MRLLTKSVVGVGCWLLVACSTPKVEYRYATIPAALIPPEPELVEIKAEELKCLSDDTWEKLKTNVTNWREYAQQLRVLLEPKQN